MPVMIDLTKKIIIKDIKGKNWVLTDIGKQALFSFLWRDNYVVKTTDERAPK